MAVDGLLATAEWALRLYGVGLVALPCWGGGKAMPGRDHRGLAAAPPTREQAAIADYDGGMAILCGTGHPAGGYLVGVDIDCGGTGFPVPPGALYVERGTTEDKRHVWLLATDLLDGQNNIIDGAGHLVAEVKGRGHAIRCYPTLPPGKPAGYRPLYLARPGDMAAPKLTSRQMAEALADYLAHVLGEMVHIAGRTPHGGAVVPVGPGVARLVAQELERRGVVLRPTGRDGWLSGRCPLHDDRRPSFSMNIQLGAWTCHAGCGSGGLRTLARRLRLSLPRPSHGHWRPAIGWEVTI